MSIVSQLNTMIPARATLYGYSDESYTVGVTAPELLLFPLGIPLHFNPENLQTTHTASYQSVSSLSGGKDKEIRTQTSGVTLNLSLTLDSTLPERRVYSVQQIIEALTVLVHGVDMLTSNPVRVKFVYGPTTYEGLMTSLSINRSLFNRQGEPIQATVSFTIKGVHYKTDTTVGAGLKIPNLTVPDLTVLPAVIALIAGLTAASAAAAAGEREGDSVDYVSAAVDNDLDSLNQPQVGENLMVGH